MYAEPFICPGNALTHTATPTILGVTALAQVAIFVSAAAATYEAVHRLIDPQDVKHLGALAAAGLIGYAGNRLAAIVRANAGRALDSPALVADGNHAKEDAYVSLAVVAGAAAVALGLQLADPLIGLGISALIMRITWQSCEWYATDTPPALASASARSRPRSRLRRHRDSGRSRGHRGGDRRRRRP